MEGTAETPATLARLDGSNSFADYCRFFHNASEQLRQPALGLQLGRVNQLANMHGPVSTVVFQSSDLRDCLLLLERFTPLRLTVIRTTLVEDTQHLGLQVELKESAGDAHIPVIETLLLSLTGLISAVSQGMVRPQQVEFDYARPAHAEQYKAAFGASSYRFSRPKLRVLIASKDARLPTGTDTDPELRAAAIRRCEELLRGVLGHQSTSDTIRQIFADNPGHLWTLSDIAGHLNMSDRTLQRRLNAEGTGYQQLHNAWLKSEAQQLLQEDNLSIESIALLLGYSDVSNFRHACRRWYALSPNEYRKRLRAGGMMPGR